MSFTRTSTSATAAFKFASSISSQARPIRCPQCFRKFPSSALHGPSPRRRLQTAAAHRPSHLEPPPLPPRNTGIPNTSIAGDVHEADSSRQSRWAETRQSDPASSSNQSTTIDVSESEAQKPKPTESVSSPASSPSPSSTKSKRPKLRPRKAAMHLTPTAVTQLQDLLNQPDPKYIRVGVKNRGCSGLAYHLEYVDEPGKFDEAVEQDGVKVLVDSKALFSIIGSEMDWAEDKLNRRFIFRNPNISK